jgi:Gas vesicle protein
MTSARETMEHGKGSIMQHPAEGPARSAPGMDPYSQSRDFGDVLERVLDKGVVIAGDISINLLDIELLTVKLRLLVASVDKAREIGLDWWSADPYLSGRARELHEENHALKQRLKSVEKKLSSGSSQGSPQKEDSERQLAQHRGR